MDACMMCGRAAVAVTPSGPVCQAGAVVYYRALVKAGADDTRELVASAEPVGHYDIYARQCQSCPRLFYLHFPRGAKQRIRRVLCPGCLSAMNQQKARRPRKDQLA